MLRSILTRRLKPGETVTQRFKQFAYKYRRGLTVWGVSSAAYAAYNLEQAPVTNRWRIQAISIPTEIELAKRMQIDDLSRAQLVPEQSEVYEYTERILSALIHKAEALYFPPAWRNQIPWRIRIVNSPVVNAYCGPGGNIVLFTGLINFCVRAEEEGRVDSCAAALGGVLCHEISHGIARHPMENLSWLPFFMGAALILQVFLFSLGMTSADVFFIKDLVDYFTQLVLRLPQSRKMESEADLIACALLTATNFPTKDFPKMLALLAEAGTFSGSAQQKKLQRKEAPEYLSTHPASKRRASQAEAYLKRHSGLLEDGNEDAQALMREASRAFRKFAATHPMPVHGGGIRG